MKEQDLMPGEVKTFYQLLHFLRFILYFLRSFDDHYFFSDGLPRGQTEGLRRKNITSPMGCACAARARAGGTAGGQHRACSQRLAHTLFYY